MKRKSFWNSLLVFCLIGFSTIASFISCEVGLGPAVDVESPDIKITTPPTSAIIRDSFAIAGTWEDDGSIKSLNVTLKDTGTKKEYSVPATLEQEPDTKEFKGAWKAIVEPKSSQNPIPDGSYEATITISDNGNHSTTITKSFVIDNTPPIIVLTRPSTAADSLSSDTYGQTFTLEGQAADTNNVSLIEVEIYSDKDCTPESYLHTVPLANVPNSINMDVAQFKKDDTTNDYYKIYQDATTEGGAKQFYCKLIAYDGAERYPVEGERTAADEKGNPISTYYLYKDIATDILQKYKINTVYQMLNGTYDGEATDTARSATTTNVLAKLHEKVKTIGKFTLNPKNNPTFAVTGRSPLLLDGHDFDGVANNISDGSQVVVEVSPGLDGILLDEDSLKVYAIECEADGKPKTGANKIYPDTTKSESGTSYRFVTTISREKGFEIDSTYIFGVEGYDQSEAKNKVEPASNGYGFRMAPSGKAPTLVVNTPESPAYVREGGVTKDGSVLKFSGTVAVEAGKPELKLYRGNNKTPIHEFNFDNQTPQHVDREYVYTFEYECDAFIGASAQSDFKLEASQSGNISEYKPTITVLYVKGDPTLKTTIKGPLVDADIYPDSANSQNLDNINGNFDFEGTVSQKVGLYDVIDYDNSSWTFTGTDKNGSAKTETGNLAAAFAGKINTLNYKDKTIATLTIVVKDLAGNEKSESHQFFINQESDKPRFTAQNFDVAVTTEAELDLRVAKKKQNILEEGVLTNMFSTSQVMKYTVEDDDGIKDTKVKVGNGALQDADGFALPDGKSELTFYVYDTNYDSSKDATYNANYVYSFTVWVLKGQAPTVDIISTPDYVTTLNTNVAANAKKTFTVTGTVSGVGEYTLSYQDPDTNNPGTHKIYYKLTSQEDTSYTEVAISSDGLYHLYPEPAQGQTVEEAYKKSITWKDEFTPYNGSTSGTVQYTINGALNSTDKEFNFRVDSGRPTIEWNTDSVQATGSTIYSTSYRFNGKAADSGISGLTKVEIQFTDKGGSPDESKWMAADGTGDWYKNIYFANGEFSCFTNQSEKTIHVRATDGAGNYSTIYTKDFKYDTEYPTITINNKPNGYLPKTAYSLTGYITEKYGITSGTKLIVREFLKNGSNYQKQGSDHELTITKGTGEDQYNYSWAMSIPFVSNLSGDLKYTFTISDANGNPLNADELLLTRDIVDPVVVISSPSSNTFGINSISGTSATLSGTVKEKDNDKLYYQIKSGTTAADSNWTEYDISDLANETDTWRVPVQLEESEYPAGKYTLYVKAKDKAGNESTVKSQAFSIDRADPAVEVKVMKREGNTSTTVTETLDGSQTIKVASGTGYDIQIAATDDSGIQSIILYDITTSPRTEVSLKDQANKKITLNQISTEGTKSYKVIVKDKSGNGIDNGKTVEKTISVIYDKNDPTASIDTIENDNDWISGTGKVYISGEAKDNSGIKSIKMTLDDGTESTEKPVPVADPWTYELDCSSLPENTDATDSNYKLVLTVEDNCEKETTVTRYFKLDKTTPVIKNLSVKNATTGSFTKSIADVKASYQAYDGITTRPVTVTVSAKDEDNNDVVIDGTTDLEIELSTTAGQFSDKAVSNKSLGDGEYTFTIKATDYAGNSVQEEKVITVDNTPPTVTTPTLDNWNDKHSSAKINVTFTDVNPDAVYYYVNDYSSTTITAANKVGDNDWTVMTLAETTTENQYTASKSHSFADGHGVVYVKVVDKAGNISYGTTAAYEVDTKAPDICTLDKVDGATLNGSKLINGQNNVTFTVNASDYNDNNIQATGKPEGNDVTRVASVKLTKIGSTTYTGNNIVNGEATLTNGTTGSKTGEWTITIPKAKFNGMTTGSYPVTVTVADTKGNKKDFQLFTLDVDQGNPEIKSYALDSSYDAGLVGETGSKIQTFYVNNTRDAFKLTGIAKDDREIDKVTLTLTGTVGGAAKTKTLTSEDSAWTFEIANDDAADAWKKWTGSVTATLSVVDKAKNATETPTAENKLPPLTFKIIFDIDGPDGDHLFDYKEKVVNGNTTIIRKDLFFRVGDQENDDITRSSTNPQWSDAIDTDVGGKYMAGTFGNRETIKIRGNFDDGTNGSGVAMIYYKLFNTIPPTDGEITSFVGSPETGDGYFAPKTSGTSRRVFYNNSNGSVTLPTGYTANGPVSGKYYTEIASTYINTISGFTEGHNYLVLVAVDNVGNAKADVISDSETYYTINVDTQPPEITTLDDVVYTNASATKTISVTVTDQIGVNIDPAGVKKVTITIKDPDDSDNDIKKTAELSDDNKYSVSLTAAELESLCAANNVKSYTISVSAVDDAGTGNSSTIPVGTLTIDRKAPTAEIGNISDADKSTDAIDVNGTLAISGTASDETSLASVALHYQKDGETTWTEITHVGGTKNNWSANLDTTGLDDDTDYTIRVTVKDSAGNTTTKPQTIHVNQDSDRPVVKFTNLNSENGNYILKYGNDASLEGTITDDDATSDAVVDVFLASTTQITSETGWEETPAGSGIWKHSTYGTTTFNKSTGDYTFTPKETEDGSKDVYFYVKDNNGKVFYTNESTDTGATLTRPKQQFKTDSAVDNNNKLTYKSDSQSPVINWAKVQAYTDEEGDTQNGTQIALGESCSVGGETKNYIDIAVSARDGNGINRIEISANGTTYSSTVTADGTKTQDDGNGNFIFTTKRIDLTGVDQGTVEVTVTVYDNSNLYSNQTTSFFVDRTAPGIDITTPASDGVTYYGTIKQNIAAGLIGGGDVSKVYFKVSEDGTLEDFTDGIDITSVSAVSASIVFDGDTASTENGYHTSNLHDWIKELRKNDATYNIDENDNNVPLYVYYKAVDSCGNFNVAKRLINVIPNGDKPTVTISYPENKNGATPALAGTIRLYGTTDIKAWSVDSVYIQIAPDYPESGTGYNWDDWESALLDVTTAYTVVEIPFSGTKQQDGTYINNKRGIKAAGTADNWNLPINSAKEFDVQSGQRHMAVRVFAVSDTGTDEQGRKKGKVSDPVVQPFNVDITAPHIGGDDSDATNRISLQLVQFESGKEGQLNKIVSRAAYKSDMWVTGNWYLLASVWDDNGIKTITLDEHKNAGVKNLVNAAEAQSVTTVDSKTCYVTGTDTPANAKATNFNICIPLPTGAADTSGSVTYTIEATENTPANLSSVETVKINYDNTPPKIGGSNYFLGTENMFANPKVYDEDGFYMLKGYVSDSGDNASGLLGVAFYFVRRGSKNSVYDPMYYQKNEVSIASAKSITDTLANNDIVYANGLYWKHKTLEARTDSLTEIKLAAADVNIHKGGLVMLGGQIYKIANLSADGKTITLNDSAPKTITTADFALAMLVDNRNTESQGGRTQNFTDNTAYGYGYYPFNANEDDGDLMVERLGGDLEGRWEASIYSHNIKDGPIEIHYVAFDKAQNYTIGIIGNVAKATYEGYQTKDALEAAKLTTDGKPSTESTASGNLISYYDYYYDPSRPASVSNNAPRVASVTVGVDYDNSGTITDSERETEYAGRTVEVRGKTKTREITDKFDVSKIFTIKAKADIGFEIIGGNGNLYYRYKMGNSAWQKNLDASNNPIPMTVTPYSETVGAETFKEGKYLDDETGVPYYNASKVSPIQIPLSTINTLVTANTSAASPSLWTIELWDSTEDTVVFTNSQFAQVNLKCNVQTRDTEAPNTVISPLYWKSSTDNSVYINPTTDKLEGHIELKDYLTAALRTEYDDGATTGDDKVSGKVVFRGYAWDNKLLKKLEWAIVNKDGTKSLLPYDASTIQYQYGAQYTNGDWDELDTLSSSGYLFTVKTGKTATFNTDGKEAYIDKKGHKVAWELVVDTSKVFGVSVQDVKLYVRATDAADKVTVMTAEASPAASVTDQEAIDRGTKKPTYKVDIVPYITGIKSRLDDNRSSNGVYQLADDEDDLELIGYNLKAGNENLPIDVPTASTNNYSVTVNTHPSINNLNNNEAVGGITDPIEAAKVRNKYNYQPSDYNDTLTDDVAIQLWQFNNRAACTFSGVGFIAEPVMKYNSFSGMLGFAFSNGANRFSMAYGTHASNGNSTTEYSYQLWEYNYAKYVRNALAFDESGRSHGISVGIDTEPSSGKAGRMNYFYSAWGRSRFNSSSGNFNTQTRTINDNRDPFNRENYGYALHIDTIGIPNANDYTDDDPTIAGDWSTTVIVEDRFKSPSIIAANHGTDPTVYIAYYDDILERIVFRWGTVGDTYKEYENLTTTELAEHSFPIASGKYSLIAGGTSVDGDTALTPYNAGEYVDLGLVKGDSTTTDVVCVVWYDAIKGNLMYSYKINPCNENFASETNTGSGYWSAAQTLKKNCGEYCKIAVDKNGGIHIAAYDNGNKGVGYVYLPSYDTEYSEATDYYLIDAMNGPFDELGIDVTIGGTNSNYAYPTISYYANGTPKMATYSTGILKTSGTPQKSWENGKFTGKWDVCFVPTSSKLLKDHINVACPKTVDGVMTPTGSSDGFLNEPTLTTYRENNTNSQRYLTNTVTSNGTSNPILGYAIREGSIGYLEIAQRK